MHYTIKSKNSRHFDLSDERGQPLGSLYFSWFFNKAQFTMNDGNIYNIAPAGFWQRIMNITKNGLTYAEVKMKWDRLELRFENGGSYVFRKKSLWGGNFILTDEEQREIAAVKSEFKWRALNFGYEIDVLANMPDREIVLTMPFILIYCTKYYRATRS